MDAMPWEDLCRITLKKPIMASSPWLAHLFTHTHTHHLTHQHVNARSLGFFAVCLSPRRLTSTLPVPIEVSQSKEAWSNRGFEISFTFKNQRSNPRKSAGFDLSITNLT